MLHCIAEPNSYLKVVSLTQSVVLGDTKYQVPILPIPGSRMVVPRLKLVLFNTRYCHMAMWPEASLHSFNICCIWILGFPKLKNSFPREAHVLLKPANVNLLLSLNKDLCENSYGIDFRRGLRYWYQYWYLSIPAQKYLVLVSKLKYGITQHYQSVFNFLPDL